jgi:uncharacterized Zn finger protein
MSRWDRSRFFTPSPKKPPPKHGIRMKKAGTTWWGQRWIEALQSVLGGDSGRLARGRTYARAGRTHDLVVRGSKVSARVTGSRATPYETTIELAPLEDRVWERAIAAMAAKAQFSADLLAGEMPKLIEEAFQLAKASLFPAQRAEIVTSCTCPDWGNPCKHVAATHYVLGEALDRDPFLLFELRGRTKDQVLSRLRIARGSDEDTHDDAPELEIAGVSLGSVSQADYDRPREALPTLHFSFDTPATHGALLRQLGKPAAWRGDQSPADALAELVSAAAQTARGIAMADPETPVRPGPVERERKPIRKLAKRWKPK